ncbi:hypothetical protein C7212DRAFT_329024 [Tuber magnatum]|uniref:Uncharacterized protein n=1 Tax=Tuber magnatum TaxID=42249 RepID=A0A317SKZ9_9PEZI|nr:hypothetical protein C7212DRAFT_329024 [Tuber magnatum]
MSEYSFASDSDSDSGSIIMTPTSGSEYSPEASLRESSPSFSSHDSGSDGSDYDDDEGDAEAEWQESLQQLELLLGMVLVPFIGKWVGRKCAYIAWSKFMSWMYPVDAVMEKAAPKIMFSVAVSSPW